ncbi:acyltransferase family protein [Acidicapsa ligni]|uniref:acyltransferase family protein n=1 Tax=Acidicapsa ligni TaxID=542300 RepID=UPI0021E06280|nr:acyltransferase [Acidicapsa ligni]
MENKISRFDQPPRHILALDGVRGFAAASVFIFHYGGGAKSSILPIRILGSIIHFGWAGVSLFFVLSGFLISGILWDSFQRPNWWRRFYARRSLRIFPLYYLAILITAITGLVLGASLKDLSTIWVPALYLGNVPFVTSHFTYAPPGIHLEHFWSLAVEEQFYLIWPFLLALFASHRLRAKKLILILWTLSLVFRLSVIGLPHDDSWQTGFIFGRAGELLAGAYLAMVVRGESLEREQLFRWSPMITCCSLVVLVLICIYSGGPELGAPLMATVGLAACSTFFAGIVGWALRPGLCQSFFQAPFLRWLGKISYGIYIYHLLFRTGYIWVADRIGGGLGYNARAILQFVVAAIATLAIASLSFYTFESFFLRSKDRLT